MISLHIFFSKVWELKGISSAYSNNILNKICDKIARQLRKFCYDIICDVKVRINETKNCSHAIASNSTVNEVLQ